VRRRTSSEVVALISFQVLQGTEWMAMPVRAIYRTAEPLSVTLLFQQAGESVAWEFARELLGTGCHFPAGTGDVKIAPSLERVGVTTMTLTSPTGTAYLRAPNSALRDFLRDSYELVPEGSEVVDVDAFLAAAGVA
jgi:sporulation and cell division protein SsgA